jgi:tetratricopeptide (TPR) repeat protein
VYFDPSHVTLAELLKAKGYSTGAFIGAQVLSSVLGLNRGFDTYEDRFANESQSQRRAGEVNRVAFEWLEKQKDNPVFLFLHYYDPHTDYDPPEPFATTFKESPYAGEISYTDHCIGKVIDKLKSLDMYESSLIIVTGDHGEMLGEHGELTHKFFIYQSAIKVPLVYKVPGANTSRKIDDLVGIIDIVPTVCDLLDIEPPTPIQGKSLAGYFKNKPPQPEERYFYCESLYATKYGTNPLLGLVSKRWKYIQTTRPELYDLQKDPGEQKNLVEAEPQRTRILKDRLAQMLEKSERLEKPLEETPLDARTLRHLQTLGYVTLNSVERNFSFDQSKEDPKDVIGFHNEFQKIHNLLKHKNLTEVRSLGDSLIKLRPQFCELYDLLLGTALSQKDYEAAIAYGKKALALKPGRFNEHYFMGVTYSQIKQNEDAARHFESALKFIPKDQTFYLPLRIQIHKLLGEIRLAQKKFALAIAQFQEALKLNPNQPEILNTFAWTLLTCSDQTLRDSRKALELAQKACELTQSKHPGYLNTLAVAYGKNNNLSEAINISEEAVALAQATGDQALVTKLRKQLYLIKRALEELKN